MGTKFYGIGAAENKDNAGELLHINGLDISKLNLVKDEHEDDSNWTKVGGVSFAKKIFSEKDCEDQQQLRCWNHAKVPLVFVRGELADGEGHPNAEASAALLKFSKKPGIALDVGLSIDGGIISKTDAQGRPTEESGEGINILKSQAIAVSLTVKPCNPKCVTFLENDLMKSIQNMAMPAGFLEALKKSQSRRSFHEINDKDFTLLMKLTKLKKSLDDYQGGFTSMRCHGCGQGVRFFKSSKDIPNVCSKCGKSHTMSGLWAALNK